MVVGVAVLLTGCWDQRPVESRAAVAAIGVDPTPKPGVLAYTFVFPDATITASSVASTKPSQEFYSVTVTAPSLFFALKQVQSKQSRALYLGQVRIVALSTALPPATWRQTLFTMADSGRFVMTMWLVGTADARRLVEEVPPTDVVPEVALYRAMTCRCQAIHWPGRGWRVWDMAATPGVSIHVADVTTTGSTFAVRSLLVIGSHAQPWNAQASAGWAYLTGHINRDMMAVTVGGVPVTIALIRGSSHAHIQEQQGHLVVQDDLTYSGVLVSGAQSGANLPSDGHVEQAVAAHLHDAVWAAWQMARRTDTDPMGWHRDAAWIDRRWARPPQDWHGWQLKPVVHFTLREEGVLR